MRIKSGKKRKLSVYGTLTKALAVRRLSNEEAPNLSRSGRKSRIGGKRSMWFLAGVGMLLVGVTTAIASGGESHGAITPANAAIAAAILSLLILPAERSFRR
jgi:hypothetical protein